MVRCPNCGRTKTGKVWMKRNKFRSDLTIPEEVCPPCSEILARYEKEAVEFEDFCDTVQRHGYAVEYGPIKKHVGDVTVELSPSIPGVFPLGATIIYGEGRYDCYAEMKNGKDWKESIAQVLLDIEAMALSKSGPAFDSKPLWKS